MDGLTAARPSTNWVRFNLDETESLSTSTSAYDELWTILHYYSEITENGLELVRRRAAFTSPQVINDDLFVSRLLHKFQAYVRQAKSYFDAARISSVRTSPLLHYYGFLNLAKAILLFHKQDYTNEDRAYHGLTLPENRLPLEQDAVVLTQRSRPPIFPDLLDVFLSGQARPSRIAVKDLLAYCSDVDYQLRLCFSEPCRLLPASLVSLSVMNSPNTPNNNTHWPFLAILDFERLRPSANSLQSFFDYFQEVSYDKNTAREVFGIHAVAWARMSFFESKTTYPMCGTPPAGNIRPVREAVRGALGDLLADNYFHEEVARISFFVAMPIDDATQFVLPEGLAIYALFFYLAWLVRYYPQHLESILGSKESWLLDSVATSCPLTFLRFATSKIVGTRYILYQR